MKRIALLLVSILYVGCSTVTINPSGNKLETEPTYSESLPFFIVGLIGEHDVNVSEICKGSSPVQMQTQDSFMNSFLGIVTFGIYTPRTAKVWCQKEASR